MKLYYSLLFVLFVSNIFAQKDIQFIIYDYTDDINKPEVDTVTIIEKTERLDVLFVGKYLNINNFMPESFINKSYKNENLTIWYNGDGSILKKKVDKFSTDKEKNDSLNFRESFKAIDIELSNIPSYSYTYDSLSRLILFSFNGCMNCNRIPEFYKVIYDESGLLTKIVEDYYIKATTEFIYDKNQDIREIRIYEDVKKPLRIIKRK